MRTRATALAAAWLALLPVAAGAAAARPDGEGPIELEVESVDRLWSARTCEALAGLGERLALAAGFCRADGDGRLTLSVGAEPLSLTLDAAAPREARRALAETVATLGNPSLDGGDPDGLRAGEVVFAAGLGLSDRLEVLPEGRYLDRYTGRVLDFGAAWDVYRADLPPDPRPLRAAAELGLVLGVGTVWYHTEASLNRTDWQYASFSESLRAKLVTFEAWRFDDNRMWLNSPGHVVSGGIYYQVGRANGLSPFASLGVATAGSTVWELFIEYREVMSFSDILLGSVAAAALGEATWQLGDLFARGDDLPLYRLLAVLFGAPGALNRWLDGTPPGTAPALDRVGLPADTWHDLQLAIGAAATEDAEDRTRTTLAIGFDTELVLLPAWRQPVTSRRWVLGPTRTRLGARVLADGRGVQDFLLEANAVFAARHDQSLRPGARGPVGYALLLGLATDWRQRTRSSEGFTDRHAVLGLVGPVVDLVVLQGPLELRLGAEAYPDFALVQARGFPAWRAARDADGVRSVLREQGYYYALGATVAARGEARWRGLRLGAELVLDRFGSIDGVDRFQEAVTEPVDLADGRLERRAWAGVQLPRGLGQLRVTLEDWESWGEVAEAGAVEARGTTDEVRVVGAWVAEF